MFESDEPIDGTPPEQPHEEPATPEEVEPPAATAEEPVTPVISAPAGFTPNKLDQFLGFFVGANFSDYYTRRDVNDITIFAPLTWISAGMAAGGVALTLDVYAGIPFAASLIPAAAAYTFLDRSIVRTESIAKADRAYEKEVLTRYAEKKPTRHILSSALNRIVPVSFRLSLALCTAAITGGVFMERIARPEVAAKTLESFQADNKKALQDREAAQMKYQAQIDSLQQRVTAIQNGMTEQLPLPPVSVVRAPADQIRFDAATKQITGLNAQIATVQQQLTSDQTKMEAEDIGAPAPGTTGIAGKKKNWLKAKLAVDGDNRAIAQLRAQEEAPQHILDQIAAQDRKVMSAEAASARANAGTIAQNSKALLPELQAELTQLKSGKAKAFADIDEAMKNSGEFKPMDEEKGLFADMRHLEDYLHDPKTGLIAAGFMRIIEMFIILAELSAVIGVVTRKTTPSEVMDARKRAGVIGQIEREVIGELEEIIPMRKRLLAMAETPWDKMQGFYRPGEAPKGPKATDGPKL